jgi:hypothetical protein
MSIGEGFLTFNYILMTLKDKKELDKVLQIVMPDDYYKDMRDSLLPHLIKWHESKVKNLSSNTVLADSLPKTGDEFWIDDDGNNRCKCCSQIM